MADFTLRDLYQDELSDLLSVERQMVDALPVMMAAVASEALREALSTHRERSRIHAERLELILNRGGMAQPTDTRSGIDDLVRMAKIRIRDSADRAVRDAALIAAARHMGHYQMAGYGVARTYARLLDDGEAADLLQHTLDEEIGADKDLTRIAEADISREAMTYEPDEKVRPRLHYVNIEDLQNKAPFGDLKIRDPKNQDLGRLDGFVVDAKGRPYYLVINSGGWLGGHRHLVPVGMGELRHSENVLVIDLDKETLQRHPEFHRDAFLTMSDEEARRYEWRVLEAIDPERARRTRHDWQYQDFDCYAEPPWVETTVIDVIAVPGGK